MAEMCCGRYLLDSGRVTLGICTLPGLDTQSALRLAFAWKIENEMHCTVSLNSAHASKCILYYYRIQYTVETGC